MDSLLPPELRSQSTERIVSAVRSVSEALTANLLVSDLSAINRACRQLSFLIRVERAHRIEEVENLLVSVVDWLYGSIERVELQVNDQTLHKLTDLITLLLRYEKLVILTILFATQHLIIVLVAVCFMKSERICFLILLLFLLTLIIIIMTLLSF